jgi:membrane-bound lytic murein transglycosylase A
MIASLPARLATASLLLMLSACATKPPDEPPMAPPTPVPLPQPRVEPPSLPSPPPGATLKPADWSALPDWQADAPAAAWPALLQSCTVLRRQSVWQVPCTAAAAMPAPDDAGARTFFERHFQPWQATQDDGSDEGLVTGYYEPLLSGDRVRTERASYPVYAVPDDLVTVDLASVYPELKNLRLRGKLAGKRLVPYPTRRVIDAPDFKGKALAWVDDPVDLFFLQIQGSGRIELPDGSHLRVGYADQNGHPYKSIGKLLVERGELALDQASMQGIKDWGEKNPDKLAELLAANPSYVFFRELPNGLAGPLGALGVPLTAERSIAVDPRFIPLGAPVFLATTQPNSTQPLNRLMLAQDTGGAIRGGVRADFFWGFGDAAGERAGRMKQRGRMWVLLPKDYPLTAVQH